MAPRPGTRPGALIPYAWAPGWNSPQSWNKFQDEVGGHLQGGDPGIRLIEPAGGGAAMRYADGIPGRIRRARRRVAGAAARAYLRKRRAFRTRRAARGSHSGRLRRAPSRRCRRPRRPTRIRLLEVSLPGETVFLPLRRRSDLPRGTVGLAVGVPGAPWFAAGASVKLGKGSAHVSGWTLPLTAVLIAAVEVAGAAARLGDRRCHADLGRATLACAVAGPLRPQPRRALRPSASDGGHDQDLLQGRLGARLRGSSGVSARARCWP